MEPEIVSPVTPEPTPVMTPPPAPEVKTGGSMGAIVGIIIIVIVIVAGAFYVWSQHAFSPELSEEELESAALASEANTKAQIEAMQSVNTSTEITDIEADINNTDLGAVLNDLGSLDAEVN